MNFKTAIIALFSALVLFTSCKKDNPAIPEEQAPKVIVVTGEWEGTYSTRGNLPITAYFNFVVNKDGTIFIKKEKGGAYSADGTWSLKGDLFTANYSYNEGVYKYYISATVNENGDTMTGTYAGGTVGNIVGDIKMKKK